MVFLLECSEQVVRVVDVGLLSAFGASCEQKDEHVRLLREVDPVSGTEVVAELGDPSPTVLMSPTGLPASAHCLMRATIRLRSLLFLRDLSQLSNSSVVLISISLLYPMDYIWASTDATRQAQHLAYVATPPV
ncbi:hypothetical protein BG22_08175 [Bifidobacterium sp. UTBIF-78]|nr:hypothetical protein BG22_08175 [Bifidobacterium sp. UTBIF-78]